MPPEFGEALLNSHESNTNPSEPLLPLSDSENTAKVCLSPQAEPTEDSASTGLGPSPPSRNVTIILVYTWFVFAGRSIWNQNVLANFAFLLRGGDPKAVGFLTAAMGISQLIVSFPAGYLANRYRRDTLLKVSSGIRVAAVATSLVALHYASYALLVVSLCVWGLYWGCAQTSITALFADSIPDGQRSRYITTRSILIKCGQLAGPSTALVLFLQMGDKWTIHECSTVMAIGQIICLPAVFLLCWLDDDAAVPNQEEEEGEQQEPLLLPRPPGDTNNGAETAFESDRARASDEQDEEPLEESPSHENTEHDETYDQVRLGKYFPFVSEERIIPTLVAIADVTSGLASGMVSILSIPNSSKSLSLCHSLILLLPSPFGIFPSSLRTTCTLALLLCKYCI